MARSHGDGNFETSNFRLFGNNVIIENGVLVFHPENININDNVYVGHNTILKGYYKGLMTIGQGTWIGQQCFFHSAGGLEIGSNVGIGPCVKIFTSTHEEEGVEIPILHSKLNFQKVVIGDDCDLGIGSIILPGVKLGRGVLVGAGAVVNKSFPDFSVIAGVPAKLIKNRLK
jgi:acetyltransferase-like isoleucine patch superfamily enzyme